MKWCRCKTWQTWRVSSVLLQRRGDVHTDRPWLGRLCVWVKGCCRKAMQLLTQHARGPVELPTYYSLPSHNSRQCLTHAGRGLFAGQRRYTLNSFVAWSGARRVSPAHGWRQHCRSLATCALHAYLPACQCVTAALQHLETVGNLSATCVCACPHSARRILCPFILEQRCASTCWRPACCLE